MTRDDDFPRSAFTYAEGVVHGARQERDRMRALVIEARRFDGIEVDGHRWIRSDQVEAAIESGVVRT